MLSATSIANYIECKVHFHELAATYAMWKRNGLDSYAREWMWRAMEHASYVRLYPGTIVPACTHFNASRLLVESHGVRCSMIMCQKSASCHTPGQKWREDNAGNLSFIFAYTSMYLCWPKLPHYSDGKAPSRSPSWQTERTFHHDNCPFLSDASHTISLQHGGLAWCAYSHVDLRTMRAHSSQSLR